MEFSKEHEYVVGSFKEGEEGKLLLRFTLEYKPEENDEPEPDILEVEIHTLEDFLKLADKIAKGDFTEFNTKRVSRYYDEDSYTIVYLEKKEPREDVKLRYEEVKKHNESIYQKFLKVKETADTLIDKNRKGEDFTEELNQIHSSVFCTYMKDFR